MAQIIPTLPRSHFRNLDKWPARLILLLLAFAMVASIVPARQTTQIPPATSAQEDGDLVLYQAIIHRMRGGQGYYPAAIQEQRARHYPLRPFVTVRLPTLAFVIASLGDGAAKALLMLIWAAALLAWRARLLRQFHLPIWATIGALALFSSVGPIAKTHYVTVHELWAGGLLTLSLGLYRPDRWLPSFIAATLALALREHILPFVLLMGTCAMLHRRWREGLAWAAAVIGFLLLLYGHMLHVTALSVAADNASPGWMQFGGIGNMMSYFYQSSWLRILPDAWSYPFIVLSIFGWLSWHHPLGQRTSLTLLGYGMMFAIIGRPDTFYWSFLVGPLLGMGMVFLRISLPDIVGAA
ncbi:MAG: hypothetical protein KGN98_04505, partial [Alphaproteobacteria bacterium]|nr:hypothetical protein [Alphaproteobacteria bacterium]